MATAPPQPVELAFMIQLVSRFHTVLCLPKRMCSYCNLNATHHFVIDYVISLIFISVEEPEAKTLKSAGAASVKQPTSKYYKCTKCAQKFLLPSFLASHLNKGKQ